MGGTYCPFRQFTGMWYVQIGKKQFNLGKAKADAFQKYHHLKRFRMSAGNQDDAFYSDPVSVSRGEAEVSSVGFIA